MRASLDPIQDFVVENAKDELRDGLKVTATEIADWKREYDLDSFFLLIDPALIDC